MRRRMVARGKHRSRHRRVIADRTTTHDAERNLGVGKMVWREWKISGGASAERDGAGLVMNEAIGSWLVSRKWYGVTISTSPSDVEIVTAQFPQIAGGVAFVPSRAVIALRSN